MFQTTVPPLQMQLSREHCNQAWTCPRRAVRNFSTVLCVVGLYRKCTSDVFCERVPGAHIRVFVSHYGASACTLIGHLPVRNKPVFLHWCAQIYVLVHTGARMREFDIRVHFGRVFVHPDALRTRVCACKFTISPHVCGCTINACLRTLMHNKPVCVYAHAPKYVFIHVDAQLKTRIYAPHAFMRRREHGNAYCRRTRRAVVAAYRQRVWGR